MIDETFLTTEEVLAYLQVNLRTVYRLIKAGKIPAVRVGRQWRFRKSDIDAWLDSQHSRPPASPARDSQAAPASVPAYHVTNARPRILVVDDEPSIRDLLAKTLALAEYDVDVAADGRSALDRMRHEAYDRETVSALEMFRHWYEPIRDPDWVRRYQAAPIAVRAKK